MDERAVENLRAMRRGIERARGFSLFSAVCEDDPARYIEALAESMPGVTQHRVRVPEDAADVVAALLAAGASDPTGPVHALGMAAPLLDSGEERGRRFARAINMSRDDWGRRLPAPVVLWLTPRAEGFLGREAPDFMDHRAGLFEFPPEPQSGAATADRAFRSDDWSGGTDGRWDADERRARIEELESRIALYGESDDPKVLASVADWHGELGNHFLTLGDLDQAEEHYREALELNEKLEWFEGMASNHGSLGILYRIRGEPDTAENHYRESLAIYEKFGRLEGMSIQFGNLGNLYLAGGELDKAEQYYRKSLAIEEKLGRPEGMAAAYGNLGVLYKTSGEFDEAEGHYRKSLAIYEKLGRLEGMASGYANLGVLYRTRGELDRAEEHYRKALALNEKLGRLEGMAIQYANLGSLYEARGDLKAALENWRKARDLYRRLGAPHMVEKVQRWIDEAEGRAGGSDGSAPGGD